MIKVNRTSPEKIFHEFFSEINRSAFCGSLIKRKCALQKNRIESIEQKRKASEKTFVKKSGVPNKVK